MQRHFRVSAFAAVFIVALVGVAGATTNCSVVSGDLHALIYTLPGCQRGIFMCAHVSLTGDLAPGSEFTFTSLGKGNLTDPSQITYTGYAWITATQGHMTTDDSGRIEFNAQQPSPFHTVGTITGGDGIYRGAFGVIQVTGTINFQTQSARGGYVGVVCVPA